MDVQWIDRPGVDFSQAVLLLQRAQRLAGMRGRTVVRDGIIAARCATGLRDVGGRCVVYRDDDEAIRRRGHLIAKGARLDAWRRAAARAGHHHQNGQHRPSNHGELPDSGSGKVPSAKRTVECRRNSARDERTVRVEFEASEYTPASVGPETIFNCASSSIVCSSTNVMFGANTARITSPWGRGIAVVTVR